MKSMIEQSSFESPSMRPDTHTLVDSTIFLLFLGVGKVIAAGAAATAVGLDLSAISTETGIDILPEDRLIHMCAGTSRSCRQLSITALTSGHM